MTDRAPPEFRPDLQPRIWTCKQCQRRNAMFPEQGADRPLVFHERCRGCGMMWTFTELEGPPLRWGMTRKKVGSRSTLPPPKFSAAPKPPENN